MRQWLNTFRPRQVVADRVVEKDGDVVIHTHVHAPAALGGFVFRHRDQFPHSRITAQRALAVLDSMEDTPND